MGYQLQRNLYRLRFTDHPGLEVSLWEPPLGFFETAAAMAPLAGKRATELQPEDVALVGKFFGTAGEHLESWNLEDSKGEPVPATAEGLRAQPLGFVMEIVEAWLDAAGDPGDPLGQPSISGTPFPVASLPMEALSPNLPSSPGPSSSSAPVSDSGASLVS